MNRDNIRGTAQNQVNQTKDYFKDKFPEERRDKFIYRLKSELRTIDNFLRTSLMHATCRGHC